MQGTARKLTLTIVNSRTPLSCTTIKIERKFSLFSNIFALFLGNSSAFDGAFLSSFDTLRRVLTEYLKKLFKKRKEVQLFVQNFVSKYGMLNAMFAVFESAKTRKSLGLLVYGRRVTRYGRSKSVYSPFQTGKQFTNTTKAGYVYINKELWSCIPCFLAETVRLK
jgi:hypothetical protein